MEFLCGQSNNIKEKGVVGSLCMSLTSLVAACGCWDGGQPGPDGGGCGGGGGGLAPRGGHSAHPADHSGSRAHLYKLQRFFQCCPDPSFQVNPDTDTDPGSPVNQDPILRIHNIGHFYLLHFAAFFILRSPYEISVGRLLFWSKTVGCEALYSFFTREILTFFLFLFLDEPERGFWTGKENCTT